MMNVEIGKIYEYTSKNGEEFCYRFAEPIIRNQDREFFGYAQVWKKTDDGSHYFNVFAGKDSFYCGQTALDVENGIEFHIAQGLC